MSVIVVNAANWPNYATLLRTEMLDLYSETSGVEFWDATAVAALDKNDFMLWGHWPKRIGAAPNRVAGELIDRVRHLADDGIDRLTVIMVFDSVEDAKAVPVGDAVAAAKPSRAIVNALTHKFYSNSDFESDLRRVAWIAAFRAGGGAEADWSAAFQVAGPAMVGQGPLFDVAVFLDKRGALGRGEQSDAWSLTALRVLIDFARDSEAADALLTPLRPSREGRVLVVTPPKPRGSPAIELRREVVALIDRALKTSNDIAQDPGVEPIDKVVEEVCERSEGVGIAKAVAAVATIYVPGEKRAPNALLEALWEVPAPPDDSDWDKIETTQDAKKQFEAFAASVDDFRAKRGDRFKKQREKLDKDVRDPQEKLRERVDAACVDPSFGLDQKFAGRLDRQREFLVAKLNRHSAAAAAHRALRLDLIASEDMTPAKQKLAGFFDGFASALDRWLPPTVVHNAGVLLLLAVALLFWALLAAPVKTGWWPLSVCGLFLVVAILGLWSVRQFRQGLVQVRQEAKAALLQARANELDDIREVSDQGIAQVVSARIAGAIVPFIEILRRHARSYERMRETMEEIENTLRAGLPPSEKPVPAARLQSETEGRAVPERFRALLWKATPAPLSTATVMFTDQRGDLAFKSSLDLPEPVEVHIPGPPARARPVDAPPTTPTGAPVVPVPAAGGAS